MQHPHRIQSFKAAFSGLGHAFIHERNLQIELVFAVLAITGAFMLGFTSIEWALLVLIILIVMTFELINTAFEHLSDLQRPRLDPVVKVAKDISAAAVLLSSIGSVVVGVILFGPKIAEYLVY